jgi:2-thiouracil desulfurase
MTGPCGRPRVGVSNCLLSEEVRFNGGHQRYRFLTDDLGPHVNWVPYCPEVSIGLGTPRADPADRGRAPGQPGGHRRPHRRDGGAPAARRRLDGYVFKAKSPSCDIRAISRYGEDGSQRRRPRPVRRPGAAGVPAAGRRGRRAAERHGPARGVQRADLRRGPAAIPARRDMGSRATWSPFTPGISCSCWRTTRSSTRPPGGSWPRRDRAGGRGRTRFCPSIAILHLRKVLAKLGIGARRDLRPALAQLGQDGQPA